MPSEQQQSNAATTAQSGRTILLVIPWMTLGGADEFNKNAIEQLRRRGHRVVVAATLDGPHPRRAEFEQLASAVHVLAEESPGGLPARLERLCELVRRERPDAVIISNSELGYYAAPLLRTVHPAAAFLDYNHMEEAWLDGGYPGYSVAFQDVFDLALVASEHLKQWMVARGAANAGARVEVCRVHVDQTRWKRNADERRRARMIMGVAAGESPGSDGLPVIIYPVRLCPQKRPHIFCRVMLALRDRGERFHAVIVGDGPDRDFVERSLREMRLEEVVHLLGPRPNAEVRRLMNGADILFIPSQWEGIALANYEAMAMGLAVVGADVGGQRELITPATGVLLPRPPPASSFPARRRRTTKSRRTPPLCRNSCATRSAGWRWAGPPASESPTTSRSSRWARAWRN